MTISVLVLIAVILYSLFAVFLSRMGGKINPNLGASVFSIIALVVPLGYFLIQKFYFKITSVATTPLGLTYAILAGIAVAVWNVLMIIIFARGGNLSYVYPVVYGAGAVFVPTMIGWLFFKEVISRTQAIGLIFIFVGVLIVIISKIK